MERGGAAISSSRIRRLILLGQVRAAALLLGRDYFFRSTVEHGAERGRLLGYPTANLKITPNKLLPANGVYAIRVLIDAAVYIGALNLGFRPTFGGNTLTVEAFLLDFEGDLYGRRLTVELWERLRDERAFESEQDLIAQIARDVEETRAATRPASSLLP